MREPGRWKTAAWAVGGVAVALLIAVYAGSIGKAERGSFVMNYPASGAESGGPSPRALTGEIAVPLGRMGLIKSLLQPNVVDVVSHNVRNVGSTPRRIRFATLGFETAAGDPVRIEAHSRDRKWDPATKTIDRDLGPGESVDFGLLMTLPERLPAIAVPVKGTVIILDALTGELLSSLDVRFERAGYPAVGDCCE